MSVKADIKVGLCLNEVTYNIDVSIPASNPTGEAPYRFNVAQEGVDSALLDVAVGGKDQFYVAVKPPEDVLKLTQGIVTNLEVVVDDGDFDPESGKFKEEDDDAES